MFVLLVAALACLQGVADGELLMVQTLTRHGERAPDKVVAEKVCRKVWPSVDAMIEDFSALPGRLIPKGVDSMRQVGQFIRKRYIEKAQFLDSSYQLHPMDWDFVAREGFRQQRSASAITLGIFPNEPVPINVQPRSEDAILGGPAPACGEFTAKMIVDWHKDEGVKYVHKQDPKVIEYFEQMCGIELRDNPYNAAPGGANPHALIGDVSDTLDSAVVGGVKLPANFTPQLHEELTRIAFDLEQLSHYTDAKGATMFAGDFPEALLQSFESWSTLQSGESRPKKSPKLRSYSCSRELQYGLEHMFGWEESLAIPGQPKGRVISGTTFVFELHRNETHFFVRSLWWTPGMDEPISLQPDTALSHMREHYEKYIAKNGGDWAKICDFKHYNAAHEHHEEGRKFVNPQTIPVNHANLVMDPLLSISAEAVDDDDVAVPQGSAALQTLPETSALRSPVSPGSSNFWVAFAAVFLGICVITVYRSRMQEGYQRI